MHNIADDECFIKVFQYTRTQERKKALKSGGPQGLNGIDLYCKNLISMKKLEAMAPWPPILTPMLGLAVLLMYFNRLWS